MVTAKASATPTWTTGHSLGLGLCLAGIVSLELLMPIALRVVTWLNVVVLLAAFTLVVGHGITGRWLGVLIDTANRMSLSRLQMLFWTFVVLSGLLTAVTANIQAHVNEPLAITIPAPLWLLMGISTASMVGSPILQHIQSNRATNTKAQQQAMEHQSLDPTSIRIGSENVINQGVDGASIADIFAGSDISTLGLVDIGQMQMFFFTLILLFTYGVGLAHLFSTPAPILALPTLDVGMVALLSISHAGFLANKALAQRG